MIPKFRAWDKFYECMITPAGIELENGEASHIIEHLPGETTKSSITYYELMQSTGLKDKNGVEIFEGDVVKVTDDRWGNDSIISDVIWFGDTEWQYPAFDLNGLYISTDFHFEANTLNTCILENKVEIIGNKYEHPHLLEE